MEWSHPLCLSVCLTSFVPRSPALWRYDVPLYDIHLHVVPSPRPFRSRRKPPKSHRVQCTTANCWSESGNLSLGWVCEPVIRCFILVSITPISCHKVCVHFLFTLTSCSYPFPVYTHFSIVLECDKSTRTVRILCCYGNKMNDVLLNFSQSSSTFHP